MIDRSRDELRKGAEVEGRDVEFRAEVELLRRGLFRANPNQPTYRLGPDGPVVAKPEFVPAGDDDEKSE